MPLKIASLLLLTLCFTFCHGQKSNLATTNSTAAQKEPAQQAKISRAPTDKADLGIRAALTDKAGNVWFGTNGKGAYRYDGKSFTHFTTNNGLTDNTIYTMLEDNAGNLWFGTETGICRYDGKTFTHIPFPVASGGNSAFMNPTYNKVTAKKTGVFAIAQDKTGTLWFCSAAGVFCYNGKTLSPFLTPKSPINPKGFTLLTAQSVLEDKAGNIWFTTWFEGIVRYNGKTLTNFTPNNEVWFTSLLQDNQGYIWSTRRGNGLIRYNGKTFENLLQHGVLDSCTAGATLQDRHGNIWFTAMHGNLAKRATTGGLWRYDGKTFTNYLTKDGLPDNTVLSITEDKSGHIWTGTRNLGLVRFDGKTFTRFSE